MNMFNRTAILIVVSGITAAICPRIVVASSNEQVCNDATQQRLQAADYGSDAANKAKPIIVPFALPRVMNIIKRSNRGELNSFAERSDAIKNELEAGSIKWLVKDPDKVSDEATTQIEPLLESECKGVR